MREAVEVMARDAARRHYARRFGKPVDNPHVSLNAEGNWRALYGAEMEQALAALDAAGYVVVSRADLEQVVTAANRNEWHPLGARLAAMLAAAQVEG